MYELCEEPSRRESTLTKFLKWCLQHSDPQYMNATPQPMKPQLDSSNQLFFTIFNAIGGTVVEFRRTNHQLGRQDTSLYVINKEEDIGDRIARIIALENFK